MVRWALACRIRRANYLDFQSLKRDIDRRRVRSYSRNKSWADCIMSTRSCTLGYTRIDA